MLTYTDDSGRCREIATGRFAKTDVAVPDETCVNGCVRYGDWWVPADCPTHLGGC